MGFGGGAWQALAGRLRFGLIVSVLRTDCLAAKPDIVFDATGARITAGGRVITVSDLDVTVQ